VIAAKRDEAVEHHKAGRAQEARNTLMEAKRLEASVPSTTVSSDYTQQWDELENALQDIIREHMDMNAGDGATYKLVSADLPRFEAIALEVSKRRKLANVEPPRFQLERVSRQREVVLQSLRSEELVVTVKGLEDMVDDEGKRLFVQISIDASLLVDENNNPPSISQSTNIAQGSGALNHTVSFPIKRSQRHARRYEKRGLDILLKSKTRSFFGMTSEELLAEGKMKLSPLITKCLHNESVSLHLPGQARKTRRGTLSIELRTHHPIGTDGDGKDVRNVMMTNLVIASWKGVAAPLQASAPPPSTSSASNVKTAKRASANPGKSAASGAASGVSNAQLNQQFAQLTPQERQQPLSAQHIVSEAVLNQVS
jgi:hypothetical protein